MINPIGEWASYREAGAEGERGGGGDVRGQGEVCHLRLQGQDGGDGQRTGKRIIFIYFLKMHKRMFYPAFFQLWKNYIFFAAIYLLICVIRRNFSHFILY